jgi:hypothetical protein
MPRLEAPQYQTFLLIGPYTFPPPQSSSRSPFLRYHTNTGLQLDQRSAFHSVVDKAVVGYTQ